MTGEISGFLNVPGSSRNDPGGLHGLLHNHSSKVSSCPGEFFASEMSESKAFVMYGIKDIHKNGQNKEIYKNLFATEQ